MNVKKRLSNIEKELTPPGPKRIIVRLVDDNGDYPELEEDMRSGGRIISVRLPEEDGGE